ncbi:ferredoxin [Microtetraspora sp. NBRC 16547]|uniref:ferredoxin n=1 Tax=Microtetraspora sp. NBRC 16547 TaxID=3030993 RepID=UPI0024A049E5|nr:ferredoxin [Microtetraspora sp. NBRC 16547]GLW99439.1 hypothetical protein Misp02_35260 [Microtetraspora sp. NBRC 16547]
MRIELNQQLCEGHSQCEIIAPQYFEVREDGKAHLLRTDLPPEDRELLAEVVLRCPVVAVRVGEES